MRLVCLLAITAAASVINDETSLIQIQKALKPGSELDQIAPEELFNTGATDLQAEEFTLAEEVPATPDGCYDRGCFGGSGPACGGNEFDCTSLGYVATGYYKQCSQNDKCQSGWKVRCASCPAAPAPSTMPPPAALPSYWQAPAAVTAAPAATAAPAVAPQLPTQIGWRPSTTVVQDTYTIDTTAASGWGGMCLCPDGIQYGVGDNFQACGAAWATNPNCKGGFIIGKCNKFNKDATLAGGWSGGKVECANPQSNTPLNILIKALNNATAIRKQVTANITQFSQKEKSAQATANKQRSQAVTFSKKVQMANVTVFKATKAMADAYFSQKGASQQSQTALANMKNSNTKVRYYQKVLVDKKQAVVDAQAAVAIGKAAVDKATSDLSIAQKASQQYQQLLNKKNTRAQRYANAQVADAQTASVNSGMQGAYIESSPIDRNQSNVPANGGGLWSASQRLTN